MSTRAVSSIDRTYRGFSCPHEGLGDAALEFVVVEYARTLCWAFLNRFADKLDTNADGLVALFRRWLERAGGFDEAWTMGLGRIRAALRPGREKESVQAGIEFALGIQAGGFPGSWTAKLDGPARLCWDGWLFDAEQELTVASDGAYATLQSGRSSTEPCATFWRRDGRWDGERAQPLPQAGRVDSPLTVLMPNALTCAAFDDIRPRLATGIEAGEIVRTLQDALTLLAEEAPHYANWVAGLVRAVIPLARPADEQYLSGSYTDRPGTITCSFPAPADMVCELLVHEASHQYLYVLRKLGAMDDGRDTALYYSPAREQHRPLFYILLAYHAFSNVALYHRDCLNYGSRHSALSLQREHELHDWLRQLEPPLRANPALTPLGRALWKPLAERLRVDGTVAERLRVDGTVAEKVRR